ncbi:MAG TPA: TonB-dependent receptor [Steroidobacteraceae bacterium]|jgi:iron complex outermembrane receptor protein|nr:TonB-dependent receptor [Steroidobacteraceae bacterium]
MTTRKVALLLSSIASVAFSTAAFAEPAPAPAPAGAAATTTTSPSEDNSIQEIVVTAEKRSENLETVPVAISAYTSKARDLIGIESIQDITNFTPGLAYSTGLDRAFIRGIGRETNILATQPGVATYADGVYGYSVVAVSGDSMFQDRVEVLRGPQGTLYGRNSIGGTIDAISKHPTRDWEAEVRINVGNFGVHNFEGSLSGPISDTMRFKFAGYKNDQTQGYYNNLANGTTTGGNGNYFYWEAQFEWDVTPDVEFWLKADQLGYNQSYFFGNTGGSYEYAPYGTFSLTPTPGFGLANGIGVTPANALITNPGITNLHNISVSDVPSNATLSRTYQITPQLTWHTPWASDLKYIGGYTTYYYNLNTDDNLTQNYNGADITSYIYPVIPGSKQCGGVDCPPLTVYPTPQFHYVQNESYYSNELNLTSHSDSSLQWIAGLYQYHEKWDQPISIAEPAQGNADKGCVTIVAAVLGPNAGCLQTPVNLAAGKLPTLAAANPNNLIYWQEAQMQGNSYAAFGQTDWKFLPTWKLTTGLRFTYDKLAGIESYRELCLGLPACLGLSGYAPGAPPLPQYLLTGPALFGAFTPVNDITTSAAGIASCVTAAGCKYRGVTGPPTLNPANGLWQRGLSDHWDALTGTAGLEWTPDDNTLGYLKYTRGYKSGGFNAGTITAAPESDPEHVDAFEVGGKEVFNKTIQINGAVFLYDYKNLQDPLDVLPAGGGPAFSSIVNIPKVISFGAEFESIWQPIANLQLLLDYSYLDATIRSDFTVQNPVALTFVDVKGQTVPESPRHKVATNGNYTWHFTPGALNFSASYIWKAKTYDSIFNQPYYLAPAYGQIDSRLSWNDASDRYTVFLYGKNLQNKLGYSNVGAQRVNSPEAGFPQYSSAYELTPPRTYGIEIQYRLK